MKSDLKDRQDVELLVNTFYDKVKTNELIGYIFDEIANVNWDEHLPRMYSFWSSLLLSEHSYLGNPMEKHINLSKITTLSEEEFSEWRRLFDETVDALFTGEKADEAKMKAQNIARLMLYKIESANRFGL